MNLFWKIIFWMMVIGLAFFNPIISFGLLVLYYLPSIVKSACDACKEESKDIDEEGNYFEVKIPFIFTFTKKEPNYSESPHSMKDMKSYSDDMLEDMK